MNNKKYDEIINMDGTDINITEIDGMELFQSWITLTRMIDYWYFSDIPDTPRMAISSIVEGICFSRLPDWASKNSSDAKTEYDRFIKMNDIIINLETIPYHEINSAWIEIGLRLVNDFDLSQDFDAAFSFKGGSKKLINKINKFFDENQQWLRVHQDNNKNNKTEINNSPSQ